MNLNPNNSSVERQCFRCKTTLPLTREFFHAEKSRPEGFSYECKCCHNERKIGRSRIKEKWSNKTPEQKAATRDRQRRYAQTSKGRALFLASAYKKIDSAKGQSSEITQQFLIDSIFSSLCTYCGTTEQLGCDRIDNSIGHTIANVVPCCARCNLTRGDRFTHGEMKIIGKTIAFISS